MKLPAKLSEVARALSPTAWLISAAALALILLTLWWLVIGGPAHDRRAAVKANAQATYARSRTDAAADAAGVVDQVHAAALQSADLTRKNADDIHAAPGADQRLDPALNDAGRRGMCQRPSYRRTAECVQLLGPG
jgi:type VI protein secretion system component VasK